MDSITTIFFSNPLWNLIIFFVVPMICIFCLGRLSPFQSSSESTDFVKEKTKNQRECSSEFMTAEELLRGNLAKKGDLIEFKRFAGVYDHWGVYIGNEHLIHLVPKGQNGRTEVRKDKLGKVAGIGKCRVNNLEAAAERRGFALKEQNRIVETALRLYHECKTGSDDPIQYNLMTFNCEHFATSCAFGAAFSEQADNAETKKSINYIAGYINWSVHSLQD